MPKSTFVYAIYIAGSAETVWKALLDGEFTRQYWGHENVSTWQLGSTWEHRKDNADGKVASFTCHSFHDLVSADDVSFHDLVPADVLYVPAQSDVVAAAGLCRDPLPLP